ncbi:hypothetical protein ARMGADRAFT_1076068 [Armillaria gallica]|uniref:LysM domain-containing protein n=1 Tax=Armillaria gallica TaxID=47427 RepID=A0A2H3E1M8_ARMGA|nr:hypothetical protein ARMGADRAFT_1076068 [Armillaria gallica]
MFVRTFILIAATIIGVNAACDNGLPGYTHIVNSGETCWGIATQGGIDVARLETANPGINCDSLTIGQAKALRSQQLMSDLSKGMCAHVPETFTLAATALVANFAGTESRHRRTIRSFPPRRQELRYDNNPPFEYDKPLLFETVLTGPRGLDELEFLEQSLRHCDTVREDCDQLDGNITIAQATLEPVRRLNDIVLSETFIACHKDMNNRVATGYCNSLNSEHPP